VGESYAEKPVGNYSPRPHSVLGKIIKQQIIHKPNHTQNPFLKSHRKKPELFPFQFAGHTATLDNNTQSTNKIWKLHGGENYGYWVTNGGRIFLRNLSNKVQKDTLMTNIPTSDIIVIQIVSQKCKLHM